MLELSLEILTLQMQLNLIESQNLVSQATYERVIRLASRFNRNTAVEDPNDSKDEFLAPSDLTIQTSIFRTLYDLFSEKKEDWEREALDIIESRKSIESKEIACLALTCMLTDGKIEERINEWSVIVK